MLRTASIQSKNPNYKIIIVKQKPKTKAKNNKGNRYLKPVQKKIRYKKRSKINGLKYVFKLIKIST